MPPPSYLDCFLKRIKEAKLISFWSLFSPCLAQSFWEASEFFSEGLRALLSWILFLGSYFEQENNLWTNSCYQLYCHTTICECFPHVELKLANDSSVPHIGPFIQLQNFLFTYPCETVSWIKSSMFLCFLAVEQELCDSSELLSLPNVNWW